MRLLILFLAYSLTGCAKPQPVYSPTAALGPPPQVITLSEQEVTQVKQRFSLLRSEMSAQQALVTLGLAQHRDHLFGLSASSGQSGSIMYMLSEGHKFVLHYQ